MSSYQSTCFILSCFAPTFSLTPSPRVREITGSFSNTSCSLLLLKAASYSILPLSSTILSTTAMSHSGIMSCNTPISSPLTAPRAESIRPSTPKRSVTPSRTDRGLSEASAFQISPKVDEALIKVEGHNDHILTTVGDVADFLPFQ
jgi:hypothetical protein